ncbi:MAG: hypothetical protein OXM54_17100 [Acidimicrobiaceae bacterium]|nr:hypothetical protein [Acidimicrobiaceae bacterium]
MLLAGSVLAVVPAGGAGALQSSSPPLVSNIEQTSNRRTSGSDLAVAFTTGSRAAGYTLTSVDLLFGRMDDADLGSRLSVTVNADSGGVPGAVVGTLANPEFEASASERRYRFTHAGLQLDPDATYWIVADVTAAPQGIHEFGRTTSAAEDPGSAAGWSIADTALSRAWSDTGWDTASNNTNRKLNVSINGHACPGSQAFSAAGVSVRHTGDGVPAAASAYAHTASGECAVLVEEGAQFTLSFTAGAPRYVRLDLSDDVERVGSSGVGWLSTFFTGAAAGSTLTFRAGADAASVGGVGHARVAFSPWGSTRNRMYVPVVIVPAYDGPDLSLPEVGVMAFHAERAEGQSAAFRLVRPEGFTGEVKVRVSQQGDFVLPAQDGLLGERTWTNTNASFSTVDDGAWEPDGQITVELLAGDGYRVSSSQGSATVRVLNDDDLGVVTPAAVELGPDLTAGVHNPAGSSTGGRWGAHGSVCHVGVWTGSTHERLDDDGRPQRHDQDGDPIAPNGELRHWGACVKGAEATYQIALTGDPGGRVTVTAQANSADVGICAYGGCHRMRRSRDGANHQTVTLGFDSTNWNRPKTVIVYRYPRTAAKTLAIDHTTNHANRHTIPSAAVTLTGSSDYQTVHPPTPPPPVYDNDDEYEPLTDYASRCGATLDRTTPRDAGPGVPDVDCAPEARGDVTEPPVERPEPDCTAREDIVRLVQSYHNANAGRGGYAGNWAKVLAAFDRHADPPWNNATPFTAADARTQETHWKGWTPIRIELDRITNCQ